MKDKWFHFFTNLFFISQNKIVKFKKLLFFIWTMIKFPKFNNLENLWNLEKLLNNLSVQVI